MSERVQATRDPADPGTRMIAVAGIVGAVRVRVWKVGKANLGVSVELPDGPIQSGLARWDDSPEIVAMKPEHDGVWRIDSGKIHARGETFREAVEDFAHCMVRYPREWMNVCCGDPLSGFGPGTPILRD